MSRGHSGRKGRSRCCSKIGPHARAHKAASVIRRHAIKAGEGVVQPMPMPRQIDSPPSHFKPFQRTSDTVSEVAHDLPKSVTEPVVTERRLGGRVVVVFDYSGGVS